jgi:pyruvyltransferase
LDYAKVKEKINSEDILVINVLDSVEKVLDDIYSCEKTLSSSLHGIIASNTYGIASTWVEFSKKLTGDGSKFIDYFLSINTKPYKPVNLINEIPNSKILIDIANKNGRMINQIDIDKLMKTCPFNCQWKGDCLPKDTKSFIVLTKK